MNEFKNKEGQRNQMKKYWSDAAGLNKGDDFTEDYRLCDWRRLVSRL